MTIRLPTSLQWLIASATARLPLPLAACVLPGNTMMLMSRTFFELRERRAIVGLAGCARFAAGQRRRLDVAGRERFGHDLRPARAGRGGRRIEQQDLGERGGVGPAIQDNDRRGRRLRRSEHEAAGRASIGVGRREALVGILRRRDRLHRFLNRRGNGRPIDLIVGAREHLRRDGDFNRPGAQAIQVDGERLVGRNRGAEEVDGLRHAAAGERGRLERRGHVVRPQPNQPRAGVHQRHRIARIAVVHRQTAERLVGLEDIGHAASGHVTDLERETLVRRIGLLDPHVKVVPPRAFGRRQDSQRPGRRLAIEIEEGRLGVRRRGIGGAHDIRVLATVLVERPGGETHRVGRAGERAIHGLVLAHAVDQRGYPDRATPCLADQGGHRGCYCVDRSCPAADLLEIHTGMQIGRHANSSREYLPRSSNEPHTVAPNAS